MLVLVTLPVLFSHGLFEHTIVFVSFESVKSPISMALLQTLYIFLENAGELRFIALEREKGPHYCKLYMNAQFLGT